MGGALSLSLLLMLLLLLSLVASLLGPTVLVTMSGTTWQFTGTSSDVLAAALLVVESVYSFFILFHFYNMLKRRYESTSRGLLYDCVQYVLYCWNILDVASRRALIDTVILNPKNHIFLAITRDSHFWCDHKNWSLYRIVISLCWSQNPITKICWLDIITNFRSQKLWSDFVIIHNDTEIMPRYKKSSFVISNF